MSVHAFIKTIANAHVRMYIQTLPHYIRLDLKRQKGILRIWKLVFNLLAPSISTAKRLEIDSRGYQRKGHIFLVFEKRLNPFYANAKKFAPPPLKPMQKKFWTPLRVKYRFQNHKEPKTHIIHSMSIFMASKHIVQSSTLYI